MKKRFNDPGDEQETVEAPPAPVDAPTEGAATPEPAADAAY